MKHLFAFLSAILLLSACSNSTDSDDVIVDPDLHPIVTNTGQLLSVDGSKMHIAYTYDEQGRVTYAERFDSSWYVVKLIAEYKYESDRIYITFQEFAEMPNGERNSTYSRDYVRDDTLFLQNGRVDSCAGAMRHRNNSFCYKFRYNERGELTYVRDDNFKRNYWGKLEEKPWYTEIYQLEWQDGNVLRRTNIDPIHRDTTVCTYRYSSLTGSCIVSEPRNVLPDFEPLMQTGYFGKSCKNLFESLEAKAYTTQTAYQLDEQGKVGLVKSNVTWDDGTSLDYAYSIKWTRGNW
ncbi:MAG: DUF4595 domain-containing protein [Bacteroidaceae bacterium]|nr:DUF4595 domain-containing protein [Bacteroidaceae bacterium]